MRLAIFLILVLNMADALLTIHAVGSGFGIELNPIMADLLALGPSIFAFFKMFIAAAVCAILFLRRETSASKYLAAYISGIYTAIVITNILLLVKFYE